MTTQLVLQPQDRPKPDISAIPPQEKTERTQKPLILLLSGLVVVAGIRCDR